MSEKKKKRLTPAAKAILENLDKVEELSRGGHNATAIGLHFGVSKSTFYEYMENWSEISDAIKKGRCTLVGDVKSALTKRAMGYDYEEVTTYIKQENGKSVQTVEKRKKHQPPDVGACHLLLKNFDEDWHNDDKKTLELKAKELELKEKRAEADTW